MSRMLVSRALVVTLCSMSLSSGDLNKKNITLAYKNCELYETVLENRIRIRMFLGLPDPDPLVSGSDPDPSLFLINVLSGLK